LCWRAKSSSLTFSATSSSSFDAIQFSDHSNRSFHRRQWTGKGLQFTCFANGNPNLSPVPFRFWIRGLFLTFRISWHDGSHLKMNDFTADVWWSLKHSELWFWTIKRIFSTVSLRWSWEFRNLNGKETTARSFALKSQKKNCT
jgi:hypothetical protein